MDTRFQEIQSAVAADQMSSTRVRLLSVSFDPDGDTADALRARATNLGADPGTGRFARAPRETVDRFAAAFGVNVVREADGTVTHNPRTAVIGPGRRVARMRVARMYDGNSWTAGQVVSDLRQALSDR
jgi:protein SCO1/2